MCTSRQDYYREERKRPSARRIQPIKGRGAARHRVCCGLSPAALLLQLPVALLQCGCQGAHVQARPPVLRLGLQHLGAPQHSTEIQPLQAPKHTSDMLCLTDCKNGSFVAGQHHKGGMAVPAGLSYWALDYDL